MFYLKTNIYADISKTIKIEKCVPFAQYLYEKIKLKEGYNNKPSENIEKIIIKTKIKKNTYISKKIIDILLFYLI